MTVNERPAMPVQHSFKDGSDQYAGQDLAEVSDQVQTHPPVKKNHINHAGDVSLSGPDQWQITPIAMGGSMCRVGALNPE
nr:hypothetical protein [uncultured Cohaesibacter sp.]